MSWDADGAPIDRPEDAVFERRKVSELFIEYRQALTEALSDGQVGRLDDIHRQIRNAVRRA